MKGMIEAATRPVSKMATGALACAWAAIGIVVAGLLIPSLPPFAAGAVLALAGIALALAAARSVFRGRVMGRMRVLRAMVLSFTALGFAAPKASGLLALERARRDSDEARRLFVDVERRIEEAESVDVQGRCDAYDQILFFTVHLRKPNQAFIRLKQTARDDTSFVKELICDGESFQYWDNGEVAHEGVASPALTAYLRRALLRMQLQDGAFLGREGRPFKAPVLEGREFAFALDVRERFPASGFRFTRKTERAPHPNGTLEFRIQAGPESRLETLELDRNTGLPWRRLSEYRVGAAVWKYDTRYDRFLLNGPIDPSRFTLPR